MKSIIETHSHLRQMIVVIAAIIGLAAGVYLWVYPITKPTVHVNRVTMTAGQATARAARLTNRLMNCFGDDTGWQCRPAGISQTEHPERIVSPIVTCVDGSCQLSGMPPISSGSIFLDGAQ